MPATATSFKEVDGGGILTTRQALIDAAGSIAPSISPETTVATYDWSIAGSPPASGVFLRIKGPTTSKVLHIKSIRVAGQAASPANTILTVSRATTAGTPNGSSVVGAIVPNKRNSTDGAPTTVVDIISGVAFDSDPAASTTVANGSLFFNDGAAGPSGEFFREFGATGDESLMLTTGQFLYLVCITNPDDVAIEIVGQEV